MNFTHKVEKLPKETFVITATVPWADVQAAYDNAFAVLAESVEVEGFRRGKAPKAVAEKHIAPEKVYDRAIRDLLPPIYDEIIKKEDLKPVINPKIDLKDAAQGKDWTIVFTVAQRPQVKLGDYKKIVAKVKKAQNTPEILIPGKEPANGGSEQEKSQKQQAMLNSILDELMNASEVDIADVIIEEELSSRLARLVDDVQKLGMTVESYLKSKQLTMEDLKASYSKEIGETHKVELILNEIAELENIQVEQEELDKLFGNVKDEKERQAVAQNAYYYAMILRKQKTLDFLLGL